MRFQVFLCAALAGLGALPLSAQKLPATAGETPEWVARQIEARHRTRLAPDDDDASVRPAGSRARTLPDRDRVARPRGTWRPRARPFLAPATSKAPPCWSGSTPRQTTSASSICRRSAASAALPAPKSKKASSAAICRTRTSAGASSTTTTTPSLSATPRGPPPTAGASGLAAGIDAPSTNDARYPRTVSLVRKDNFVVVAARHLQSPQRARKALRGPPPRADRWRLDCDRRRSWSTSCRRRAPSWS